MKSSRTNRLIYAIGNPSRGDDGLAINFLSAILERNYQQENTYNNYQLNIEDSLLISQFDSVTFVDATQDPTVEDFSLSKVRAQAGSSFSEHLFTMQSLI